MDYAISIFFLGLVVTGVVAKGLLMANEYATSERNSSDPASKVGKTGL